MTIWGPPWTGYYYIETFTGLKENFVIVVDKIMY